VTASVELFSFLVSLGLIVTAAAPVVLIILLIRDWRKGTLW
jgi:hypothetical protein